MAKPRKPRRPVAPRRIWTPPPPVADSDLVPASEMRALYSETIAQVEAENRAEEAAELTAARVRSAAAAARAAAPPEPPAPLNPMLVAMHEIDARCESPIERDLGHALLRTIAGFAPGVCGAVAVIGGWLLYCQYEIGPYRADFALVNPATHPAAIVVIEADGHEFHTAPADVARDQARDAWMRARGIRVLRFTGRRIHDEPIMCAGDVILEIERKVRR